MIEEVERLDPKLGANSLTKALFPEERKIHIHHAIRAELVAARGTECKLAWDSVRRRVEPPRRSGIAQVGIADQVRTGACGGVDSADVGNVGIGKECVWLAAANLKDRETGPLCSQRRPGPNGSS